MALKAGDIVEVAAPSSAPDKKEALEGLKILESWGLKPHLPKGAISPWLFHASPNQNRLRLLERAFLNPKARAVWALRGGYGAQKLMPSLIKSLGKKTAEKLFIGFSDTTALHLWLNGHCKIPSLHAPFVCQLPLLPQKDLIFLRQALFGEKQKLEFSGLKSFFPPKKNLRIKAPLMGGNLSIIQSSLGTPWLPSLSPSILFLEDVGEADYRVDRALHHLFFAGALKGVKALVFGAFSPLKNQRLRNRVLKSFSEFSRIPMVTGLPCGHRPSHKALPLGVPAELALSPSGAARLTTALF